MGKFDTKMSLDNNTFRIHTQCYNMDTTVTWLNATLVPVTTDQK